MKKVILLLFSLLLIITGCSTKNTSETTTSNTETNQPKSDFPSKPIEMIVPFAAGGLSDLIARSLANVVKEYLPNGQTVVVVNKPGGAGAVGLTHVFQAKPDGYTIAMISTGPVNITPHFGNTVYSHDSFQTIMNAVTTTSVLAVKADAPWKTFEEWLEYVKKNPGKFTYGTAGTTTIPHISMEGLNNAVGITTKNVPFEGNAPAVTALLGGHVQGAVISPSDIIGQLESGELRALVNFGSGVEKVGGVPSLKEKGIDAVFEASFGIVAPKGLPKNELAILHDSFKKALEDPRVTEALNKLHLSSNYAGPEEFQKELTDTFNVNGQIIKKLGLIK